MYLIQSIYIHYIGHLVAGLAGFWILDAGLVFWFDSGHPDTKKPASFWGAGFWFWWSGLFLMKLDAKEGILLDVHPDEFVLCPRDGDILEVEFLLVFPVLLAFPDHWQSLWSED